MKRFITLVLTICMCLTITATLSACNTDTTHNHTYQTVWSSDSTHHWYACEDEACTSTSQKGEHQLVNGICLVCSFEDNIETPPPATLVSNEVTEEQFYTALSIGDENIITITYTYNYAEMIGNSVLHINKNAIYFKTDDNINGTTEIYYDLREENSFLYNYLIFDEPYEYSGWVKQPIDPNDETHVAPKALEKFESMFSMVDFSDCEYSDGYYTCLVEAMTWKFQFEDGVLVSFSNTYVDDAEEFSETYIFSDYGNTVVSLPTEYIDIDEISPTPSSDWASYFEFDNVTVNSIQNTDSGEEYIVTTKETLNIAGNKKLKTYILGMTQNGNFTEISNVITYFDGQHTYEDGTLNDSADYDLASLGMITLLAQYESSFTEVQAGGYYAEQVVVPTSTMSWTDISIITENGKIQSVSYNLTQSGTDFSFVSNVVVTFSSWDTTVIDYTVNDEENNDTTLVWENYFKFDNVTINGYWNHTLYTYGEGGDVDNIEFLEEQESLAIDQSRWLYEGYLTAYFDGENIYINEEAENAGVDVSAWENEDDRFLSNILIFASFGDYFTETSTGVYEASKIGNFSNVKITLYNEQIQFIQYQYEDSNLPEADLCETLVTFIFSNQGTTTINSNIV